MHARVFLFFSFIDYRIFGQFIINLWGIRNLERFEILCKARNIKAFPTEYSAEPEILRNTRFTLGGSLSQSDTFPDRPNQAKHRSDVGNEKHFVGQISEFLSTSNDCDARKHTTL